MSRLEEFPLPEALLPEKLKALLIPMSSLDPRLMIEVAASFEQKDALPNREALHMLMLAVPSGKVCALGVLNEASTGLVAHSVPDIRARGGLRKYALNASGFDPIVMSWGSGSFFTYNLSEKVWASLGLTPRCFGNQHQKIVYDDPSAPEYAVAGGEISNEYYFEPDRNVCWTMQNQYLRRYLWMRGATGVRVFYYETLLDDGPAMQAVMQGNDHFEARPENGWYEVTLAKWEGRILLRTWASLPAVDPKLCAEPDPKQLVWPGDQQPVSDERIRSAMSMVDFLHLDDRFLEKYEQNTDYDTLPVRTPDGQWACSPSYGGQWSFVGCRRQGRNLVRVSVYDLYTKAVPPREIVHAHSHAVTPEVVARLPAEEEHIPAKAKRLVDQLLRLGDCLSELGNALALERVRPEELVGFSRAELRANGWLKYRILQKLAQVAPLAMTEAQFLARCKTLNEILQKALPNSHMKAILRIAGCRADDLRGLGSLKLLQGLVSIVQSLNEAQDDLASLHGSAAAVDWKIANPAMAPLFIAYDLRIADAHEAGRDWLLRLEELGFDTAQINDGYGRALDHVLDTVIQALGTVNTAIEDLIARP